jgi:hypothetical protein
MTTLTANSALRPIAAPLPPALSPMTPRFRTILAVHRGDVYVPISQAAGTRWMVRAAAPAPASHGARFTASWWPPD